MKPARSLPLLAAMLCSALLVAQAPHSFSYQAVMRDQLTGQPLANQPAGVSFTLHQGSAAGPVVYAEQHSTTANDQGLFTLQVGGGTPTTGTFNPILWRNGPYFLEVGLDVGSTGVFTTMGTQQLLSVPYALYAESSNIPDGTEVGQIAHWDGTTWVVDSGPYVYQKRFGIGVTTPEMPLGIKGEAGQDDQLLSFHSSDSQQKWNINLNPTGADVPGFSIDDASSGVGSSRLFIAPSTGHVGIGTTDPGAPLSIKSRADLYEEFKNGDIPDQDDFRLSSGGGTGLSFDQDTTGGSASRLFIQSGTGRIGIGTQDPPAPLAIVSRSVLKQYFQTGDHPAQSDFAFTSTDSTGFSIDQGMPGGLVSRLFIDEGTGMIGLGTTDPSSKLHIQESTPNGATTVKVQNSATATNAGWAFGHLHEPGTPGDGDLALFEDQWPNVGDFDFNDVVLRFQHGGNVGINEPLPDTKLHVSRDLGDPHASTSLEAGSGIMTVGPAAKNIVFDYKGIQAKQLVAGTTSIQGSSHLHLQPLGGPIVIHGSDAVLSHHVTVTEDGKIGIGKDPIESVDVNGAITLGNSSSPAPAAGTIRWTGTDFEGRKGSGWESITSPWLVINTKLVYNPSVPKVGIGTEQPSATLHVSRPTADTEASIALAENTGIAVLGPITDNIAMDYRGLQARHGEYIGEVLNITATTLNLQRLGGDILIHGDATLSDDQRVVIKSDGKVGLGKEPIERLDVNGAITLGDASSTTPPNGTIRWNGADFEGRKGGSWNSLTTHTNTDGLWQTEPTGGINYSPPGGGAKVSLSLPAPTGTVRVDSWAAIVERSTGAVFQNTVTTSSTDPADNRVGVEIKNSGTWGGSADSKNIGLYVSDVSGGSSANKNLAAVLNGNVVIGNVTNDEMVGAGGSGIFVIKNNGGVPTTALSSGIQMYSDPGLSGVPTFHLMNGDGSVIKLYRAPAITTADESPVGPGVDPSTAALIQNMRTRINELENVLKSLGLLTP